MSGDHPVTALQAATYVIPTDEPEADGTLAWDQTAMVVVSAAAGGQQGTGWTYASPAAQEVVTGMLADTVRGRCAMDVAGSYEAMSRAVRNVGREGIAATAISAVDIALWDLKARILDCSVTALIGQVRQSVPVYGSGGFTSYDDAQLRDQLSGWVDELAIPRVKIKVGESWGACEQRDLQRVALARGAIGDDAGLYVDANGGYNVGQAVRIGNALADFGVTWFEEPVSSQDTAGLAAVRRQVRPDVAAGEYSWTPPTPPGCWRRQRWTACKPMSPAVAGSPASCRRPRWPPLITCRFPVTARRTCTPAWRRACRTSGTSSTSVTISGSRICCSTDRWPRLAAL